MYNTYTSANLYSKYAESTVVHSVQCRHHQLSTLVSCSSAQAQLFSKSQSILTQFLTKTSVKLQSWHKHLIMASLTSNPMDDMEEEYHEGSIGHKRSFSNPGAEQTRPGSLSFTAGKSFSSQFFLNSRYIDNTISLHINKQHLPDHSKQPRRSSCEE